MFQPNTYNKNEELSGSLVKERIRAGKYHHAAYAYLFIGIVYLLVFYVTIPPHDFNTLGENFVDTKMPGLSGLLEGINYNSVINALSVGLGILFLGLSYYIYKGFRTLTIILTAIYGVRLIIATMALFSEDVFTSVKFVLPLIAITFYMLARAAFNFKP